VSNLKPFWRKRLILMRVVCWFLLIIAPITLVVSIVAAVDWDEVADSFKEIWDGARGRLR